jgi:hypothetical protein
MRRRTVDNPPLASLSSTASLTNGATLRLLNGAGGDSLPPHGLVLDGLLLDGTAWSRLVFDFEAEDAAAFVRFDRPLGGLRATIWGNVLGGEVQDGAFVSPRWWSINASYPCQQTTGAVLCSATPRSVVGWASSLASPSIT